MSEEALSERTSLFQRHLTRTTNSIIPAPNRLVNIDQLAQEGNLIYSTTRKIYPVEYIAYMELMLDRGVSLTFKDNNSSTDIRCEREFSCFYLD